MFEGAFMRRHRVPPQKDHVSESSSRRDAGGARRDHYGRDGQLVAPGPPEAVRPVQVHSGRPRS